MAKRDYYEILGVDRSASGDELKKAYRKVAMKYHPDRNPGDKKAEDKFKEASEAFEVLSDQSKRQRYDQFGHSAEGLGDGFSGFSQGAGFGDIFGDIFGEFFGANGENAEDSVESAAQTSNTILKSTSRTQLLAPQENLKYRGWKHATPAGDLGHVHRMISKPVITVAEQDSRGFNKAFSV